MSWVGMILPTPTAMVTTFILLSSEDNLRMKCLPVLSVNVYDPEFHRKLWFGSSNVRRQAVLTLDLQTSGSVSCIR